LRSNCRFLILFIDVRVASKLLVVAVKVNHGLGDARIPLIFDDVDSEAGHALRVCRSLVGASSIIFYFKVIVARVS